MRAMSLHQGARQPALRCGEWCLHERAADETDTRLPAPSCFQVVIVHPTTHKPVAEGTRGEIWLRGACVAARYIGTSHAQRLGTIPGRTQGGGYLRTGDEGFMTGAGHLVVTGRLDDMLVLHGRNVFPASAGGWEHTSHARQA